jgi:ribulose-5-phosphate 4-epimerase/fuculose-1-phosphate aldolase
MERGVDTVRVELPTFETMQEARQHRKERLTAAFRIFSQLGFDEGVAGHITARDPEYADRFWVNPFGIHFGLMKVSDLICVDESGAIVEGSGSLNRAAFAIHSQVHAARPDVVAAAHAHSLYGKAWSTLGRLLDPITQDACVFYNDHSLFEDFTGVVLDPEEGKQIAHTLGGRKAIILRNHGLLTVGGSVEEVTFLFASMERSCQAQLIAEAAGTPHLIGDQIAAQTCAEIGNHGWFSAQPLFAKICHDQPDLFD